MLDVPERTPAVYDGNAGRNCIRGAAKRWTTRVSRHPKDRFRRSALEHGIEKIGDKNQNGNRLEENADGDDEVPDFPAAAGLVGVDAARHAEKPGDVHEIEGEVEADEEEPEMQFAEGFIVKTTGHFGEPIVEGTEDSKENAADDDVVEMSDDKIRVR